MSPADHPPALPALRVFARGWDFDAWQQDFYPQDLPEDWRLGFYANEFRGVLVPDAVWRQAGAAELADWFGDLAAPFAVYLEINAAVPAERVATLQAALPAGLLQGLVLVAAGFEAPDWGVPVYRDADAAGPAGPRCWRPGREQGDGLGLIELGPNQVPPPRALREQLEAFLQASRGREQATLIVTGSPPSIAAMRDLEVMGQLLGA